MDLSFSWAGVHLFRAGYPTPTKQATLQLLSQHTTPSDSRASRARFKHISQRSQEKATAIASVVASEPASLRKIETAHCTLFGNVALPFGERRRVYASLQHILQDSLLSSSLCGEEATFNPPLQTNHPSPQIPPPESVIVAS